jgi:hypothetical protein
MWLLDTSQTLIVVSHDTKPADGLASYYNPQVKKKNHPVKGEVLRVRDTYGGDRTHWDGPCSALSASITTVKLNLNAVISEDARWMTADIVDISLGTTPAGKGGHGARSTSQARDDLRPLVKNGLVMAEISKEIYALHRRAYSFRTG